MDERRVVVHFWSPATSHIPQVIHLACRERLEWLALPIVPMLGKDEEGSKLRCILPHETRGVQIQGDVCLVARIEKDGCATPAPPLLPADKVALLEGQTVQIGLGVIGEVVDGLLKIELVAVRDAWTRWRLWVSDCGHGPMRPQAALLKAPRLRTRIEG